MNNFNQDYRPVSGMLTSVVVMETVVVMELVVVAIFLVGFVLYAVLIACVLPIVVIDSILLFMLELISSTIFRLIELLGCITQKTSLD